MDSVIPENFEKNEKKMLYLLIFGPELVCPHQGQLANHALAAHPFYVTVPAPARLRPLTRAVSPSLLFQLPFSFIGFPVSLQLCVPYSLEPWLMVEHGKRLELYLQLEMHQPVAHSGMSCLPASMRVEEWSGGLWWGSGCLLNAPCCSSQKDRLKPEKTEFSVVLLMLIWVTSWASWINNP